MLVLTYQLLIFLLFCTAMTMTKNNKKCLHKLFVGRKPVTYLLSKKLTVI